MYLHELHLLIPRPADTGYEEQVFEETALEAGGTCVLIVVSCRQAGRGAVGGDIVALPTIQVGHHARPAFGLERITVGRHGRS